MKLRPALRALVALTLLCTPPAVAGCRGESAREHTEPAAENTSAPAPTPAATDDDPDVAQAPPAPWATELGRIDVEGYVHTLALDEAGRLVMASRQGRRAAWLFDPTPTRADLDESPAALELDEPAGFASAAVPLADGLFALLRPDGQRVTVARATVTPDGTAAALERVQAIATRGVPADATLALGRLWIAARQTPDGRGLLGVDPATGELREQLLTGPTPVSLRAVDTPTPRLLALLLTDAGAGELAVLEAPPDDGALGQVVRLPFEGLPLQLVAPAEGEPRAWIVRHEHADLLPVDLSATPATLGAPLAMPFAPLSVARDGSADHLIVAHGDGRVARVAIDGATPAVERKLGRGTTELALAPDGEHLLALDPDARRLWLLARDTLETVDEHPLDGRPGRMALDRERRRVYISLPERQEVVALELE